MNKNRSFFIEYLTIFLLAVISAVHFYKQSENGLVFVTLISPFILIINRKKWSWFVLQYIVFINSIEWLKNIIKIVNFKIETQDISIKTVTILIVFFMNISCLFLIRSDKFKKRYSIDNESSTLYSFLAFLVITLLSAISYKKLNSLQPLILERILPASGWIEIFFLGIYGATVTEKILSSKSSDIIRSKIWLFFSIVFFIQLLLGISGFSIFLMNNKLHLPIPGILISGPIFRGKISFFMPFLLLTSIILVGPAWCSWLCYFGPLDLFFSKKSNNKKLTIPLKATIISRIIILLLLIIVPIVLRILKVKILITYAVGVLYGIIGVLVMIKFSRSRGIMVHCTSYCPIGLITTIIGKINPFRIKIKNSCIKCNKCINICKYDALNKKTLVKGSPDIRCTLCGDCIASCVGNHIEYSIFSLQTKIAKKIFITSIVILHTLFLGFGRV
ncbi:MAG: 4Fe-4S binding protein [Chitinispirillaceae bacterium]|nr:4Fe-4S binding protein [Chitinispirillaceae bacterium]